MDTGKIRKMVIESRLPDGRALQEIIPVNNGQDALVFVVDKPEAIGDHLKCPVCGGPTTNGACDEGHGTYA